jgi:hypothetical protein
MFAPTSSVPSELHSRQPLAFTWGCCIYDVFFGERDSVLESFFSFFIVYSLATIVSPTIQESYNRRMNDPESGSSQSPTPHHEPILFAAESPTTDSAVKGSERNWIPWIVALIVICGGLGLAFWLGRAPANSNGSGVDPYAKNVVLGNVQVSQASNFAGDQLTYVDGTIENRGTRTITAMTLQAAFPNETGDAPQILQAPLSLVRSRDPYVDTQPIGAAPLAPGKSQDFRLVFDNVTPMWNQQAPSLQIADVSTRP